MYFGGNLIGENILRKENAELIAAAPRVYEILLKITLAEDEGELDSFINEANLLIDELRG